MTMSVLEDDQTAELLSRIKNGTWLDAQVFPPLRWAVPGVIPEGFGLLVGPPKLGKSWLALGVGLAVATGGRALGRIDVPQQPVFYAALEDGERRLQDRARKLLMNESIPEGFEFVVNATPNEIIPMIEAWLDQHPGGLVLLDTLGRVMPQSLPGESAYQRDYRIGAVLKGLTDRHPGATLLVVHHVRKQGSGDWMDSTSGTNGLNGAADWTIALERARGEDAALIKVTGRDVREDEYAATIVDGSWSLRGANLAEASALAREERTTAGVGDQMSKVIEFVNKSRTPVRAKDVSDALQISGDTARQYLKRAADDGRIGRGDRGAYTCVTSVTLSRSPDRRDTRDTCDTGLGEATVTRLPLGNQPSDDGW